MVYDTQHPTDLSSLEDLKSNWSELHLAERKFAFSKLSRLDQEDLFLNLDKFSQAELLKELPVAEWRSWMRILPPDDAADLIQSLPEQFQVPALDALDGPSRKEVNALLAYAEDKAGGLMNSRFVRLRPEMTIDEALRYLRIQATSNAEMIYYAYVLDQEQKLMGVASFRELFASRAEQLVIDVMKKDFRVVHDETDQEEISRIFSQTSLSALPVVNRRGRMKGIITLDDIVRTVEEEATEDIQKLGGTEALGAPYLKIAMIAMIKKRAGWLIVLFVGELFTATAMGYFEHQIERAVVLALFIPLIISSGGNSGSQATTLVIRAMALKEVRLRDWTRVLMRELSAGLVLGCILGLIGLLRIFFWPARETLYGSHYGLVAITVSFSLVGIVLWGTIAGSMLPFLLKRLGFDPASASAPFVATLVDVTGIMIYFTVASLVLKGTLL